MSNEQINAQQNEENLNEILRFRREKLADLINEGKNPFEITKFDRTHTSKDVKENYTTEKRELHKRGSDEVEIIDAEISPLDGQEVSLAGRIMSKRGMGKVGFVHISDYYGQIQLFVKKDILGEEEYNRFKKLDIGDIIGASGEVFTTQTGEISVRVNKITLLSKSLLPLPEKFHGLVDTDLRYRQRYVDLIMNADVKKTFITRSKIIKEIREFLDNRGYMEVETPVLNTISGGATARPFVTHHNTLDIDMYLRIATELNLKRLIVGGLEKVYEIGRQFRNEGMDIKHNPEFTSIELYEAYTDYYGMMEITEDMISTVAMKVLGTTDVNYQGKVIHLAKGWEKITMTDAVKKYADVDFSGVKSSEEAVALAKSVGVEVEEGSSPGVALYEVFDEKVEGQLIQPTFILDYPVEVSPLAKKKPSDPMFTERFEFFINGAEYGNAFSELNDPIDQKERFQKQVEARENGDEEAGMMDDDYINAMEYGMPPTGGLGIGIDRLVMLLTDSYSIRDVLLFPTMKPLNDVNKGNDVKNQPVEEMNPEPEKIDFSKVKIEPLFEETVDFDTFSKSDFRAVKVKECVAVPKSKKLLQFTLDDGTGTDRTILSGIHSFYEPEELVGKTLIAITNLPPRAMMGIDSCGMLLSAIHEEEGEEKLHLLMVDDHIPAGAKLY
ncbi:MAG: lysine--tRNA ligase [Clostridia bacterium]|nr:lysine--tRNA ligase [Clostridia bacterium]